MKYAEFVRKYRKNLTRSQLQEINWLAEAELNVDVSQLLAVELDENQLEQLEQKISLYLEGTPIAHMIGSVDFFGCDITVTPDVLIPRPETELMVDLIVKDRKNCTSLEILDLCTGSGCIGIALQKALNAHVVATDISEKALEIAKKNAQNNNSHIDFIQSDMFANITGAFDVIVSNPPYICRDVIPTLPRSVREHEPKLALDGGINGLDFYNEIARHVRTHLKPGGTLYLEIGYDQDKSVPEILNRLFSNVRVIKDYSGNPRIIKAEGMKL